MLSFLTKQSELLYSLAWLSLPTVVKVREGEKSRS